MRTKMGRDGITSKDDAMRFDSEGDRDWLNPIAMSQLQAAVNAKKAQVSLNGRLFNITYGIFTTFPVSGERRESVRLKRADGGYVPMGTIPLKRILDFQFDKGGD